MKDAGAWSAGILFGNLPFEKSADFEQAICTCRFAGAALNGCKKPDETPHEPELPPLTQDGRNVLACRVNGIVHVYSGKHTLGDPNGVFYHRYVDEILLSADEADLSDAVRISLFEPNTIVANSTYVFSTKTNSCYALYYSDEANPYFITKNSSGWVRFTRIDSAIAAGTFEFIAYFENDSVNVTEGRFDIAR